jgi:hypothetical protein
MRWCGIIRVVACCVAAAVVWFRCETRTGGWVVVGEAVFVGGAGRGEASINGSSHEAHVGTLVC